MPGGDLDWVDRMFDGTEAYARTADPSPSHEAAERVRTSKLESKVYMALLERWPRYLTVVEIAEATGLGLWSVSPRMAPLVRKGLAESLIITAKNSTGNMVQMTAWRAIQRGLA